jgi:hypothetical protein
LQQKVEEQVSCIATIPELEEKYLRAARSIVNKSNISIYQRETKLQQYEDELKELRFFKGKSQELQMELNVANKTIRHLEQNMRKLNIRSGSPTKHSRAADSSVATATGSAMRRQAFHTRYEKQNQAKEDAPPAAHEDEAAAILNSPSANLPSVHSNNMDMKPVRHITFDINSSNSQKSSTATGQRGNTGTGTSKRPQSAGASSFQRPNSELEVDESKYIRFKNMSLWKKNAELKDHVVELSTKLAHARAYPLYNSTVDSTANAGNQYQHRHAMINHRRTVSASVITINSSLPTSSLPPNGAEDDDENDDDSFIENDESSIEYEEDEETQQRRRDRREEILEHYEKKIRRSQRLLPSQLKSITAKRIQSIRQNKSFSYTGIEDDLSEA